MRRIDEIRVSGPVPYLVHPEWRERWPQLVQGLTLERDYGLYGSAVAGDTMARWDALADTLAVRGLVHARQVHEATVRVHERPVDGLQLSPTCDGHITDRPGHGLVVSVADCVPVYLVAAGPGADGSDRSDDGPAGRPSAVALVHAGWRSAAAGILEEAVDLLRSRLGVAPGDLSMHMGPSICGDCYEVGPEVFAALGEPAPAGPTPVDLPANLGRRGEALGIPGERITRSGHCTLCGSLELFSHRGGSPARQMAFIGIRAGGVS